MKSDFWFYKTAFYIILVIWKNAVKFTESGANFFLFLSHFSLTCSFVAVTSFDTGGGKRKERDGRSALLRELVVWHFVGTENTTQ